jgi:predicted ATPase
VVTADIPNKDELTLFFSRLKESVRVGPFIDDISVPNIDKIYTGGDISSASNKFLHYFLSKLNTVIKTTRDIEVTVEDFIQSCNKYLSSSDIRNYRDGVTEMNVIATNISPEDKVLRLDRRTLRVHAESLRGHRKIPLNALSSGEKQMVSLFAKLFLYPKEKIVLIDEPELSLSIDWQRQILVDVVNSPLCRQVISVTHSPFVFDNELERFAKPLDVFIDLSKMPSALEEAGVSEEDLEQSQ